MAGNYIESSTPIMQNGDFYYPLTTAKQVILPDGRRLADDDGLNIAANDVNALSIDITDAEQSTANPINADTLGGQMPEYFLNQDDLSQFSQQMTTCMTAVNLLDNSDFRNPVNQRCITTLTEFGYCIDRWLFGYGSNGTFTVNTNSITIKNGWIYQFIENLDTTKTYTLVWCDDTGYIDVNNNPIRTDISSYPAVVIENTYGRNLVWAALYEGSYTAETLPPYVPKGYAVELAECMRYYQKFDGDWLAGMINDSGFCIYALHLPVEMRVTPSMNYQQNTQYPFNVFGAGEKNLLIEYITPRQRSVNFVINSADNANQYINSIQTLTLSADL